MTYYILLGSLTALFSLAAIQLKNQRFLFVLPLILLTAYFIGYRDISIGTDTLRYSEIYYDIKPLSVAYERGSFGFEAQRVETGFVVVASTMRELGLSYNQFLFFLNFITLSLIFVAYQRVCKADAPLLLFLYTCTFTYFTLQYNIVRQGIAVAICMYAMSELFVRKRLRFVAWTLVAATFHSISILFLAVLPFANFRWKRSYLLLFIPLVVLLAGVDFLQEFTTLLAPFSITIYRVSNYLLTQAEPTQLLSLSIALDMMLACYCLWDVEFLRRKNKHFELMFTAFMIGLLGMFALHELRLLSLRYFYLFSPYEVAVFVCAMSRLTGRWYLKEVLIVVLGLIWLLKNLFVTAQFITTY